MRALLLTAALVLGGCFQTEAVLTVRPDGSATLVEATRAEGVAALGMLRQPPPPLGDAALAAGLETGALGPGVRLVEVRDSAAFGSATRTLVYAVDDVGALAYRFGRGAALDGLSGAALSAAFSPTGGSPRSASAEWMTETTYTFSRADGALTVSVPPRAIATRDVWSPDTESHRLVSAGTARLRFSVRSAAGGVARLVDLHAAPLLTSLSAPADLTFAADRDYDAMRAAYDARRSAARALSDSAVGGIDRPGLFLAPAGPLTLSL